MSNLASINSMTTTPRTPYSIINSFLADYDSESTKRNYLRYFKNMFMYMCNRNLESLTYADINSINKSKVRDYRTHLKNSYKTSTINQIIRGACKALWDYFKDDEIVSGDNPFDIKSLKEEDNNYASLSDDEMNLLFNYCDSLAHLKNPYTRRMFFEFLYYVGCRKEVAVTLTWDMITNNYDNKNKINVWVVKFYDKGKWVEKAIHNDFYTRLKKLITCGESINDKVFELDENTLEETFNMFRKEYQLEYKDGKKVVIHSIKKASGWLCQNTFGDLHKTMRHLQHEHPSTTAKDYLTEGYSEQASYLMGVNVDENFFHNLSKDDIINLIDIAGLEIKLKLFYLHQNQNKKEN